MVAKTELMHQPLLPEAFVVTHSTRKKHYRLSHSTIRIGRDPATNDIVFDDPAVSSEHALIKFENNRFVLYDLGSANRTYLNKKIVQKEILMDDDIIQVGHITLTFKEVRN
jgi:pSer/pThr/pTyr-binding forkhead associated (FHA) protein